MPAGSRRYRLSPAAEADLEGIWVYTLENWSLQQADRYHALLMDRIEALCDTPGLGRRADDIREGYWQIGAGSHLIFYRQRNGEIEVVRVLHQRMDFRRHFIVRAPSTDLQGASSCCSLASTGWTFSMR